MGKRLYIGNLPYSADEQTLTDLFGQCGTVESVNIITDRETGRSRGFGFVEMSTDEEADKAIQEMHGQECKGRPLTVNEAKPQRSRFEGGRNSSRSDGGGGGGRPRW